MRSVGRWLGRLLLIVVALGAAVWFLGPLEPVARSGPAGPVDDPTSYLESREAGFDDIVPGTEARIVWAGEAGARSDVVVLYLHGFSASSEEIRPVPDRVAEALGANLIFARLPGHGRDGPAMAEPQAGDWLDDTAQMLALARQIGDRVVVIGTSTGGTLAAWAATEPDMAENVAAMVFVSPNFAVMNPAGALLEWPLAQVWAPWIAGATRSFDPVNEGQATYWTTSYPTLATVRMGALLREMRARDVSGVTIPALFLFSDADQVVSAQATRDVAARWGGATTVAPQALPEEGSDPFSHVIAGDILSPAMTEPVVETILDWLAEMLT